MTQVTAKNVAIICPTKNQPTKVLRLLESIVHLDEMPQQIIIADGGHNLKPCVNSICCATQSYLSLLPRNRANNAKKSCTCVFRQEH